MITSKTLLSAIAAACILCCSCNTVRKRDRAPILPEEDKIFHAGPVESGFGVIFFGLYKGNKYEFCDGDFMDYGCYTGDYSLSGDTISLIGLKQHQGIPTNRFLICRYSEMDSSYWEWKYPYLESSWQDRRWSDSAQGAEGDVYPLNSKGEAVWSKNDYFLIRYDKLSNHSYE